MQIGEFSKLTRLSIKALRLYDAEGLLVPASVDVTTGYRYYTYDQLGIANSIQVLRTLDMPLQNIRNLLEGEDSTHTTEGLREHRHRISGEIASKQRIVNYLDALIAAGDLKLNYDIEMEDVEAQAIASVRIETDLSSIAKDIQAGFADLIVGLQASNTLPAGSPVIVHHDVIDKDGSGDIEVAVPVNAPLSTGSGIVGRMLEGGTVARTVHKGAYTAVGPAYQALARWIAERNYEVVGPPREWYLNDPQTTAEKELLTAIEFPVKKSG